ncbi:response regulator [bacterium]|nr:MAG: response regulator [bacterium]
MNKIFCVIEDDPIHLFVTKRYLELTGLADEIVVYNNGKEAYDKLSATIHSGLRLPDFIFLDINMPIWDGWQFLTEFLKIPESNQVKIYIMSSSNSEDDYIKAEKFNLRDNYMPKPINFEDLIEIVNK